MKRWLKLLFIVSVGVFFLICIFSGIANSTFIGGKLTDLVITQLEHKLQRQLKVGEFSRVHFFPWFGVTFNDLVIDQPSQNSTLISIGHIDVKIRLIPLILHRHLALDRIVIDDMRLKLLRTKDGQTNWQDMLRPSAKGNTDESLQFSGLSSNGIAMNNAQIIWDDELSAESWHWELPRLRLAPLSLGNSSRFDLSLQVKRDQQQLPKPIVAQGQIRIQPDTQNPNNLSYIFEDLQVDISGIAALKGGITIRTQQGADTLVQAEINSYATAQGVAELFGRRDGDALDSVETKISVQGTTSMLKIVSWVAKFDFVKPIQGMNFATKQASLSLNPLRIKVDTFQINSDIGLNVQGNFMIDGLENGINYHAQLETGKFDPRKLIGLIGQPQPIFVDKEALTNMQLQCSLEGGQDYHALRDLRLHIDETEITGNLKISAATPPRWDFQLQANQLNWDHYQTKSNSIENKNNNLDITLVQKDIYKQFRNHPIDGKLLIKRLQFLKSTSTNVEIVLNNGHPVEP